MLTSKMKTNIILQLNLFCPLSAFLPIKDLLFILGGKEKKKGAQFVSFWKLFATN